MNELFTSINTFFETILFFDIFFGTVKGVTFPFVVAWLIFGGVVLTIKMRFINLRMLPHSLKIVRGVYLNDKAKGLITPFESLSTALSATVGIGNIAVVSIAITLGGPGAAFWMIMAGFLGMTLKFTEVTLSQQYREFLPNGTIMGGGMEYLSRGLATKGWHKSGKVLAFIFALFMVLGALGAGNAFQVSQALLVAKSEIPFIASYPALFGIVLASVTALVIIGGIRRIAHVAEVIVPFMVIFYLLMVLWVLLTHLSDIPHAFALIITEAFHPNAVAGGMLAAMVQGFQRAVFSNEAGLGSAGIAHAPSTVQYPIQQGLVSLYEPLVDTIIVCTMTALVVIITGIYNDPSAEITAMIDAKQGAALSAAAFGSVVSWFPSFLGIAMFLFAFSTMISWSYYGERAWVYLFGMRSSIIFKLIFIAFIIIATIVNTGLLVDFSSVLFLALAVPNILGLLLLSSDVKRYLDDYLQKLKANTL